MAHVPSNAGLEMLQMQNGIGNQLAGAMKCNQTTTIRLKEFRTQTAQVCFVIDRIVFGSDADRIDRLVFRQNENIFECRRRGIAIVSSTVECCGSGGGGGDKLL